jgi:hypothetical protein
MIERRPVGGVIATVSLVRVVLVCSGVGCGGAVAPGGQQPSDDAAATDATAVLDSSLLTTGDARTAEEASSPEDGSAEDAGAADATTGLGVTVCGNSRCNSGSQVCCDTNGMLSCTSINACASLVFECSSSGSCLRGRTCCAMSSGSVSMLTGSQCQGGLCVTGPQLCQNDLECDSGKCGDSGALFAICMPTENDQ